MQTAHKLDVCSEVQMVALTFWQAVAQEERTLADSRPIARLGSKVHTAKTAHFAWCSAAWHAGMYSVDCWLALACAGIGLGWLCAPAQRLVLVVIFYTLGAGFS